jgi:hypothetical protein
MQSDILSFHNRATEILIALSNSFAEHGFAMGSTFRGTTGASSLLLCLLLAEGQG